MYSEEHQLLAVIVSAFASNVVYGFVVWNLPSLFAVQSLLVEFSNQVTELAQISKHDFTNGVVLHSLIS